MKPVGTVHVLALTQGLSSIGSRMSGVAIGFSVFASTGKAAPILLFSFFSELPAMLAGTLAGAWVDRGEARKWVIAADLGQALGSLVLVLAFLSGGFELWQLYAVGLWQGICAMFQEPAKNSLIAALVPDEGRDRANVLMAAAHPAAGVLAPGLGGLLFGLIGVAGVVAVDLATFVLAAAGLYLVRAPGPSPLPGPRASPLPSLRSLLALLRAKPALALLLGYGAFLNFLLNGPLGLALPYTLARTGRVSASGLALSIEGLGGLLGSLLLFAGGGSRTLALFLGMGGAGLSMLALSAMSSPLLLGASLFAAVACLQAWSRFSSICQAEAPMDLQASLFALFAQLGYLGSTASFLLTGALVDSLLEPAAAGAPWWRLVSPLLGSGQGAGMGLAIAAAGLLVVASTAAMASLPAARRLGRGPEGL
jgi:MFS transporter, DHA3 family, macrolide efflux protein